MEYWKEKIYSLKKVFYNTNLKGLKTFETPDFLKKENDARLPTINEIYRSIGLSELYIDSEHKSIDNFQPKNNQQILHVFDLIENKDSYSHDLTIRYKKDLEINKKILADRIKKQYIRCRK